MLEVLKDVKQLGGFEVLHLNRTNLKEIVETTAHIIVDYPQNAITFRLQDGPVEVVGKNGCPITSLIDASKRLLEEFNKITPCEDNTVTLDHLDCALYHLEMLKLDREGTNEI